jgi:hypothetical protein
MISSQEPIGHLWWLSTTKPHLLNANPLPSNLIPQKLNIDRKKQGWTSQNFFSQTF